MSTFSLPDLGEGLAEAEIVAWHVGEGDRVVADQPLVSVETDKAVVEVPAPSAGRIARLHGAPGDIVPVGGPLVEFADDENAGEADAGTVVGEIPAPTPRAPGGKAMPAVRALAVSLGVDVTQVAPTGAGGTITRTDVESAAAGQVEGAEPLRGPRRAMARTMARAGAEVVPATVTDEAVVEGWVAAGADVMVRLIRAMVAACRAEPALNAGFDDAALVRRMSERVDLGLAMDTPDGLFVPVLRHAGGWDEADLRHEVERLRGAVAARAIGRDELRGATITLSNFGALGGRHAALVVVPPQVAILGAGRISPRVVAEGGSPAVRRVLPVSLSFDHRAVTGGEAARFLAALIADLEVTT